MNETASEGGSGKDGSRAVGCWWRIDATRVIRGVGGAWDEFARANGAPELAPEEAVLGRGLGEFVTGAEVITLYEMLMDTARERGTPVRIRLQCDGSEEIRLLEMTIEPLEGGGFRFETRPLRLESRPPVSLLAPGAERSEDRVEACSWCKRFHVDGEWLDAEAAFERLEPFLRQRPPALSHGVCPDCFRELVAS